MIKCRVGTKKFVKSGLLPCLLGLAVLAGLMISMAGDAHAIRVTLKRIIFEGAVRTETLTIVNNDSVERTYRIGWKPMRMTEDAALRSVKEGEDMSDLRSADQMIRYAPRRISLPPGASQQVRLMLRRPRDLEDGEYRSHIWIAPEAGVSKFGAPQEEGKTSVVLEMLTGITLPVFVRHGNMEISSGMENARATRNNDGGIDVAYTITRDGNRSLYGDVEFICVSADNTVLRAVRGISVYTEVSRRSLEHTINRDVNEAVSGCSRLTIRYVAENNDAQYKGGTIAEATVPVN